MNRTWIKKHGWEPVLLLAMAAACLIWWQSSVSGPAAGNLAVVSYDGQTVLKIPLDRDGFYTLKEDPTVRFQVRDGAIAFVEATCPDKVCEKEGFLSQNGQTAVCLPRKASLRIIAGDGADAPDVVAR